MAARALVTGASGGIGLEFAKLLAQAGYDVTLVARSAENLEAAAEDLRTRFGIDAHPIPIDLAQPGAADKLFAQVPSCDVLVNNAGFANNGSFYALERGAIDEEMQLDVVTLTQLCRLYLPGMIARNDGKILNVASTAGFLPGPNMAVYYASKAYVISFSEALAEELTKTNVSVTVLCPGATETGFPDRANMRSTVLGRLPLAGAAGVAKAGFKGMMSGKRVVIPGISNKLVALSPKITPRRLLVWVSGRAVRRK